MNMALYMKQFLGKDEKPLDTLLDGGGYCGILRSWGMVGDSLASGEFEWTRPDGSRGYYDRFDFSWGQFFARMTGTTVRNFLAGGMTAVHYCTAFADSKGFWNRELACEAYVIALGVNDLFNANLDIGSIDDVCCEDWRCNKPTFAGYYATIIQRYRELEPDARFFLMTFPKDSGRDERRAALAKEHRALLYAMAELFGNTYVLDLAEYGPDYADPDFRQHFMMGGHMAPIGYVFTAKLLASYVDFIIRHNPDSSKQAGFIGTPYKYLD